MSNNALQLYQKIEDPVTAVERLGTMLAKSGMFGCDKIEQGQVLAMACLAEGRSPVDIMRENHIIEGKLSMRADAMHARFQADGGKIKWVRSDAEVCEAQFSHPKFGEVPIKVTREELDKAGITQGKNGVKDNWRKFPRQMLRARCISEGIRMLHPAIVCGVYTPEEVGDFNSAPTPEPKPLFTKTEEAKPVIEARAEPVPVETPAASVTQFPDHIPALEKALESHEANANAWMIKNGWIQDGQTFRDVSRERADQVLAKVPQFIRAITPKETAK